MRHKIREEVVDILQRNKLARDNDAVLIGELFLKYGYDCKITPFAVILKKMYEGELPSFESITRARRKAQELYPELRASEDVQFARLIEQETYREEYGGGNL